jgi:hypothetical protein
MCWHQLPIQSDLHQHILELLTDSNRLANITTYQQTAAGMNHPLQG